MRSEVLVTALERGLLPPADFTHECHVQAAWHYLRRQPLQRATQQFTNVLGAYVKHVGAQNKFHLTMTVAFMHLIHARMEPHLEAGPPSSVQEWVQFRDSHPELFTRWRQLIAEHYSTEALERGRLQFVEPDLSPLP